MSKYYKVPLIREYKTEQVIDEETGEVVEEKVTDEVIAIRPDIPKGISYVGKPLDDENYIVKTDKPIKGLEALNLDEEEEEKDTGEKDSLSIEQSKERATVDSLKNAFSRGVRR